MTSFITVVPSIRTIPGVEEFDYAIDEGCGVKAGDLIRVPFRRKSLPALVTNRKAHSAFADRAIELGSPAVLLRLGRTVAGLLSASARRAFVSKPTVLNSWIRQVPKRTRPSQFIETAERQMRFAVRETRFLTNRWRGKNGLFQAAKSFKGKRLVLAPWQSRAERLSAELGCPVIHAKIPPTASWEAIVGFASGERPMLVATRLGAWLAALSDAVLLDEPENDDFKQDEMAPRIDARWIVEFCAQLRPELSFVCFSTTPRLSDRQSWDRARDIAVNLTTEPWQRFSSRADQIFSPQTLEKIGKAAKEDRPVVIIHPISGEQARIACRDCGWRATCESCGFETGLTAGRALCRRCGAKSSSPAVCPTCAGTEFSRGRAGKERMKIERAIVYDLADLNAAELPQNALIVLSDLSLVGGASEDIRRKERLIIAWRRLAAAVSSKNGELVVQGPEDAVQNCRSWLNAQGLKSAWQQEFLDRQKFGYPPAVKLTKLVVAGEEKAASKMADDLRTVLPEGFVLRGPYPVAYRPKSREARHILHVVTPHGADDKILRHLLDGFKKQAIIDLDPSAFFC